MHFKIVSDDNPGRNKNASKAFLSQNNFSDWLRDPDLVRVWHHDRKNMPKHSPETQRLLDFGHRMHQKAHELYPDGLEDTRKLSYEEHLENSMKLLQRRIPIFEPGFEFDRLYARPDIMVPAGDDAWELIEVKSTSRIYEDCIKYVAFLYYVIAKAGIRISNCQLLLLKKGIFATPEMPASEVFVRHDITEKVFELQGHIEGAIIEEGKGLGMIISRFEYMEGLKCHKLLWNIFNAPDCMPKHYDGTRGLFYDEAAAKRAAMKPISNTDYDVEKIRGFMQRIAYPISIWEIRYFTRAIS